MPKMSVKDALKAVLHDIRALTVAERKRELDQHRNGPMANAMREIRAHLDVGLHVETEKASVFHYRLEHLTGVLVPKGDAASGKFADSVMSEWDFCNDYRFALAA